MELDHFCGEGNLDFEERCFDGSECTTGVDCVDCGPRPYVPGETCHNNHERCDGFKALHCGLVQNHVGTLIQLRSRQISCVVVVAVEVPTDLVINKILYEYYDVCVT